MPMLSLCVICKNEEENIKNLLESVKGPLFDEIIIVDTNSTDKTVEVARKYTPHIYNFEWVDDFSAARNYSFSKATCEFVGWLDADDAVLPKDYQKLLALKERLNEADTWLLKYEYAHDELGRSICSFYRERIVRRSLNLKWQEPIHEYLPLTGIIKKEDIEIHHYKKHSTSARNIPMLEKSVKANPNSARNVFYLGKEYMDNGQLEEALKTLEKYVDMPDAWVENKYSAYIRLSNIIMRLNNKDIEKARSMCFAAIKTFPTRIEAYCRLGELCFDKSDWEEAVHWYKIASNMKRDTKILDLIEPRYYTWLPHLQLCVAYNNIGEVKKSALHNELAHRYASEDSRMLNNKRIFEKTLGNDYPIPEKISLKLLFDKDINIGDFEIIAFKEEKQAFVGKIGWCVANIIDAGTIRIRTLNIQKTLKNMGVVSELCTFETAQNYDYVIIGKLFSEEVLQQVRRLKDLGKTVLCDLSEDILGYAFVDDILKESDLVVCCSKELQKKVARINSNALVIEDAVDYMLA